LKFEFGKNEFNIPNTKLPTWLLLTTYRNFHCPIWHNNWPLMTWFSHNTRLQMTDNLVL